MTRGSMNPGFDQRIADWLEDDPAAAPEAVLETVLAAFPSIPQRRVFRAPWRFQPMSLPARVLAAAIAIAVVTAGGLLILRPGASGPAASPGSSRTLSPSTTVTPSATVATASVVPSGPPSDYSSLGGRILMEHLGNAPDRSEMPTTDYHPERRRLYWMNPATMTVATAQEFMRGRPTAGKLDADVSRDGSRVVFMDTADAATVWLANIDGSGLLKLSAPCGCDELDPAFDPTGTKIVFVHVEGAHRNALSGANLGYEWDGSTMVTSWLGIRDLSTGKVTRLGATSASGPDGLPYQPAWSPNGREIAFDRVYWGTTNPTAQLQVIDIQSGQVRTIPTKAGGSVSLDAKMPGDPSWSPDGSTIVFSDRPISTVGSIADLPAGLGVMTIGRDGTGLKWLADGSGASYMPDGRIVFQNNYFYVMNADGTGVLPVNIHGDDLTELDVGFAYIPHWVGTP